MKKVLSTAVFALLVSASVSVISGQTANDSQALIRKESVSQKSTESSESGSEKMTGGGSNEAQKYYESGIALYDSNKPQEALTAFKEANKFKPDNPQTHYMLGMAYAKSKAYEEAADSFKRAVGLKSDWAEAHFRLGVVAYVLGRTGQSIEAYNNLLKLNSPLSGILHRVIQGENNRASIAENMGAGVPFWLMSQREVPTVSSNQAVATSRPDATDPVPASKASTGPAPVNVDSVRAASDPPPAAEDSSLSGIYRVGVGDVLDIRLLNSFTPRSTLYSVIEGGLIDMPVAGGPIAVAGLTTEEIQMRIAAELKRRAVEEGARVSVAVRQYASHSVIITGLVSNPGTRFLRREAVPLYVLMAESQARLDAGRVAIMRLGTEKHVIDLSEPSALNFLIRPGDMLSVTARPQEFYYVGGRIGYPGQKMFQPGITLLQAILAAGGLTRKSDYVIELSREGKAGLLTTTTFKLKEIKTGKIQDPRLQPGDRIEVVR